jgi:hypothetical protein
MYHRLYSAISWLTVQLLLPFSSFFFFTGASEAFVTATTGALITGTVISYAKQICLTSRVKTSLTFSKKS